MNISNVSYTETDISHLRSHGVTHRLDQVFRADPVVKQVGSSIYFPPRHRLESKLSVDATYRLFLLEIEAGSHCPGIAMDFRRLSDFFSLRFGRRSSRFGWF